MKKFCLILFYLVILTGVSVSASSELSIESNRIDTVQAFSPENITAEIERVNESEREDFEEFGVYEAFTVEMKYYERISITLTEDKEWAQDFIDNNPGLYNGPGHNYDPGLLFLLKESDMERINLNYDDGTFRGDIFEPGEYYIALSTTSNSPKKYLDQEGNCLLLYESPGTENYEEVEDCDSSNYLFYLSLLAVSILFLGVIYRIYLFLRKKYYVKRLNSLTQEIESSESADEELLEELYNAMEDVQNGNYEEASGILDKIESREF